MQKASQYNFMYKGIKNMKKEKSIETSELRIKGNILCWYDTMIQLSNISYISTSPLELIEFPKYSILMIIAAILLFGINILVSVVLLVCAIVWIYRWFKINETRKYKTVLNICMNSGNNLCILFSSRSFLDDVLKVLEEIIIDGGVGEQNVDINIRDCNISGNAHVLDNLDISKGGSLWE